MLNFDFSYSLLTLSGAIVHLLKANLTFIMQNKSLESPWRYNIEGVIMSNIRQNIPASAIISTHLGEIKKTVILMFLNHFLKTCHSYVCDNSLKIFDANNSKSKSSIKSCN